jgi:hypothetical protein
VETLLYGAVELTTGPHTPPGCLSVRSAQACGPEAEPARQTAIARRAAGDAALLARFERARAEGDLPAGCEPADLTRLVTAISDGIAIQAAGGASRAELTRAVDTALRCWPS